MWLTFNGEKEKLRFPVLPPAITVTKGAKNRSVNITELGEITVIQGRPAVVLSFSSFFPSATFPGIAAADITPPLTLKDTVTTWQTSKKPVHFILTGQNTDLYCTIENFVYSENGGDVGTLNYTLSLKEYRETNVRRVKVEVKTQTATVTQDTTRVDNTAPPKTYTVKSGDCLWNIAKAVLGSGARYTEIYNLNTDIIKNPNLIYSGQVLKLPA
jgi:nucleoid-associated protein YgaU